MRLNAQGRAGLSRANLLAYGVAAVLAVSALSAIAFIVPADRAAPSAALGAPGIVPATFENDGRLAEAVLAAINEERRYAGLAPLAWDPALATAATDHAADMATRDYYDYASPEGLFPAERLDRSTRAAFPLVRETIWKARNRTDWRPDAAADAMVRDWMGRPGAIAALVDPDLTHAGGAIVRRGYDGRAVMLFGGAAGAVW